jgi:hypothetical protein
MRDCNHRQNTTSMNESHHSALKKELDSVRNTLRERRLDWVMGQLITVSEARCKRKHQLQLLGAVPNRIREKEMAATIKAAIEVADSRVRLPSDGQPMLISSSSAATVYAVTGPLTSTPHCTCPQGAQGRTCKHIAKAMLMLGVTPRRIYQLWGSLYGTADGAKQLAGLKESHAAAQLSQSSGNGSMVASAAMAPAAAAAATVAVDPAAPAPAGTQQLMTQQRASARVDLRWQQRGEQAVQRMTDILAAEPRDGEIWKEFYIGYARMLSAAEGALARRSEGVLAPLPEPLQANQSGCGSKRRFLSLSEIVCGKPGKRGKRGHTRPGGAAPHAPTGPSLVPNKRKGKEARARSISQKAARAQEKMALQKRSQPSVILSGVVLQKAARVPLQDVSNIDHAQHAPHVCTHAALAK